MPQATDIELRRNKISAQSATLLCELMCLSSHKPLEKLNLSNNKTLFGKLESFGMGGKEWNGAKAFSRIITLPRLTQSISAHRLRLNERGAPALCQWDLRTVHR